MKMKIQLEEEREGTKEHKLMIRIKRETYLGLYSSELL